MILTRQYENKYGLFGLLTTNDGQTFYTLERPYLSNKKNISAIPPGEYSLVTHTSGKHGKTAAIVNEDLNVHHYSQSSGRSYILFHTGNILRETDGCVMPGLDIGIVHDKLGVISSARAMYKLRECFKTDSQLIITGAS